MITCPKKKKALHGLCLNNTLYSQRKEDEESRSKQTCNWSKKVSNLRLVYSVETKKLLTTCPKKKKAS